MIRKLFCTYRYLCHKMNKYLGWEIISKQMLYAVQFPLNASLALHPTENIDFPLLCSYVIGLPLMMLLIASLFWIPGKTAQSVSFDAFFNFSKFNFNLIDEIQ